MQGNPVRPVTATIRLCFPRNKTANIVVMKGEFLKKKKKKILEFYCQFCGLITRVSQKTTYMTCTTY